MLAADLAFAVMAAATKVSGTALPAAQIVFVRSAVGMLVLFGVLAAKRISPAANQPALLLTRGVVGYIALQCYFWALPRIPLGSAVMLNYTAPIFAVALSALFLKERPSAMARAVLGLSLLGVWLLTAPQFSGDPAALSAGLMSGVLAGAVHVMIRRSNQSDDPLLIVFYFTVVCTVGSGLLTLRTGWVPPGPELRPGLLVITASSLIGQLCLTYSLQKAPVWAVSPFGYLTPVLAAGLGAVLWREIPGVSGVLGGALIIVCGSALAAHAGLSRER